MFKNTGWVGGRNVKEWYLVFFFMPLRVIRFFFVALTWLDQVFIHFLADLMEES